MPLAFNSPSFCCRQISTGLGAGIPSQRAKGEWIEGVAIWVAVFLVSGVGGSPEIVWITFTVKPVIVVESDICRDPYDHHHKP